MKISEKWLFEVFNVKNMVYNRELSKMISMINNFKEVCFYFHKDTTL